MNLQEETGLRKEPSERWLSSEIFSSVSIILEEKLISMLDNLSSILSRCTSHPNNVKLIYYHDNAVLVYLNLP